MNKTISKFIEKYYLHFNAGSLLDAAKGYVKHLQNGGKMMITLAGAMSTAELGKLLSKMIRKNKVSIISCTGANMEEDLMNLVAHSHYKRIKNYRNLTDQEELKLFKKGFNRITDTCIPEEQAFKKIEKYIFKIWEKAYKCKKRYFPHEFMYKMILSGVLKDKYEIDPNDSWMIAAAEKNIPIVVPGWEDSTIGNIFTSYCIKKELNPSIIKSGIEYMIDLSKWYLKNSNGQGIGLLQIGGGIAGDFPICVVPMLSQDLRLKNIPLWSYFCQISDSTTSYGSYSGAVPNEKITWGKLTIDTPKFIIESDATIVTPLLFGYILDM